jgi:hypothetical protein
MMVCGSEEEEREGTPKLDVFQKSRTKREGEKNEEISCVDHCVCDCGE